MRELIFFIDWLLGLFVFILVFFGILQLLIAFNVVNRHNQVVYTLSDMFYRITEPLLRPIRRRIGLYNGLDLSPLILIIIIYFIRIVILANILKYV